MIGSNTDEIWCAYTVTIYKNGDYVEHTGYISENKEIIEREEKIVSRKDVERLENEKLNRGAGRYYLDGYILDAYDYKSYIYDKNMNIVAEFEDREEVEGIYKNKITTVFEGKYVRTYEFINGNLKKLSEIQVTDEPLGFHDFEMDVNGDVWIQEDEEIFIIKNNKKEERYRVKDGFIMADVYDEKNIVFTDFNNHIIISDGEVHKPYGWIKRGGKYYLIDVYKNRQRGWQKVDGKYYYMGRDEAMQSNKWIGSYYVGNDGAMVTNKWVGDYYVDGKGKYVKNKWIGNYYCGADGKYVKNKWAGSYYCGKDGRYVKSKWIGDYYCGTDGKYVKNSWVGRYFCNSEGKYVKNTWIRVVTGNWYYCGADGLFLINTEQKINGKTYYFNEFGVCLNK